MERAGRRSPGACIDFSGVSHTFLGAGRGTGWLARRRLRAEARDLDVVAAFNLDAMELVARALPADAGVLRVGSVRGLGFTQDAGLARRLKEACEAVDLVTCNSPAIARALADAGIHPEAGITLLPNVIPLEAASARAATGRPHFLFVGNLLPVKQPEFFVAACLDALEVVPGLRVTIVGDGPLRRAVEEAIRGRADAFDILGHVPPEEVPFAEADVVVSTSIREGASNALLEAMSAGCAIVATRAGGNVDLLEESGAGLLVPVGDRSALAEGMVRLASDPDLRARLGEKGRAWVERHHNREAVTMKLAELIEGATRRRTDG